LSAPVEVLHEVFNAFGNDDDGSRQPTAAHGSCHGAE